MERKSYVLCTWENKMSLKCIKEEELIFTDNLEDDRINTYLSLNDYDWMEYTLKSKFRTEVDGTLYVTFVYNGFMTSTMFVRQMKDDQEINYKFDFDTQLFKEYIVKFLQSHIESWDSSYAFYGGEIVLEFYNKVLECTKNTLQ